VFPIDLAVTKRAKELVLAGVRVSARDAVHAAVMEKHSVTEILSFDRGFDGFPGIARLC
jgi:uncharacterized protein